MIRTNHPTEVKKRRSRNVVHFWTDKRIIRFFRKNFDKKTFKNLKNVYLALCEIESDFANMGKSEAKLFGITKTTATYAGMDSDTVRPYMKALRKANIIDYGQIIKNGQFEHCYLEMYEWSEYEEIEILRILSKKIPTVNGKTRQRENPSTGKPVNGISRSIKNTSKEVDFYKNSKEKNISKAPSEHCDILPSSDPSILLDKSPKPKKTLSAKQNQPSTGQAIEWSKVSKRFAKFMQDQFDIHIPVKEQDMATYGLIKKLNISNKISIPRMITVIDWLSEHHSDEFIPSIGNISDFYHKFSKLEAAMKRQDNPNPKQKTYGYMNKDQSPYENIVGVKWTPGKGKIEK